jgi:hypothetical protein
MTRLSTFAPSRAALRATALALWLAAGATAASAADTEAGGYVTEDHSTESLISKAAVAGIWKQGLPEDRLAKLYPKAKWGFLSQVEGGLTTGQTCVVTARVVMLPRTSPTRRLVWEPSKTSTTFDAKAGATAAQCSELAAAKLKEALQSLVTGLVKS